jgi:transcriptional regulator with XRE-family HTH domain
MTDNTLALSIRAKKLGVLLRDARLYSDKSVDECAAVLGTTPEQIQRFEMGEESPSLPELEILAFYLKVPLEHFWGQNTLIKKDSSDKNFNFQQLMKVRQKMIGALIRKARSDAGYTLEELAEKSNITPQQLVDYELGQSIVPIPNLEALAFALNCPVKDFYDLHGPVGTWLTRERAVQGLVDMPPDLQTFISKPVNRPYLELARRLSEMSVDKLRAVAEGLLEITL